MNIRILAQPVMVGSTVKGICHQAYDIEQRKLPSEVDERYKFSQYIIDPNKYRLRKVVRRLNCKARIGTLTNTLNSETNLPLTFTFMHDQHLVTKGKGSVNDSRLKKEKTLIASLTNFHGDQRNPSL